MFPARMSLQIPVTWATTSFTVQSGQPGTTVAASFSSRSATSSLMRARPSAYAAAISVIDVIDVTVAPSSALGSVDAMGPLRGLRVIEMAGIGPGPFAGMMLADMGADVVRVDRPGSGAGDPTRDVLNRGRRSVAVDLKHPDGVATVLRLVEQADALIEGFRPGVMERLGLGPDECLARNPRLVFGRMTGWGQDGPLAQAAGHDINYIALAGALNSFARKGERPVPPLNMVGDFGGGGMLLAFVVACALLATARSGPGPVVDAAMVDGAAVLMTMIHAFVAMGLWADEPGTNILDTGAHFYDVYETADDKFVAVGPIEGKFYAELLRLVGWEHEVLPWQLDRAEGPG